MKLNGFSEGLSLLANIFLLKIKKVAIKKLKVHMSNLNVRELDPPTPLHQFDANSGKIQYMSEPKSLL